MTESPRVASGVFWTVESAGVLIIPRLGRKLFLSGLEAAAWDLISRGDAPERAIPKLAVMGRVTTEDATSALTGWLREWARAGWLVGGDSDG
ncbi:MAG: hypothetical protein LAN70_02580 [Acidobacteriia bacterium]|nr:hypothetical protein [Terriglobia bacterium]